jgi:hypothetical protein
MADMMLLRKVQLRCKPYCLLTSQVFSFSGKLRSISTKSRRSPTRTTSEAAVQRGRRFAHTLHRLTRTAGQCQQTVTGAGPRYQFQRLGSPGSGGRLSSAKRAHTWRVTIHGAAHGEHWFLSRWPQRFRSRLRPLLRSSGRRIQFRPHRRSPSRIRVAAAISRFQGRVSKSVCAHLRIWRPTAALAASGTTKRRPIRGLSSATSGSGSVRAHRNGLHLAGLRRYTRCVVAVLV